MLNMVHWTRIEFSRCWMHFERNFTHQHIIWMSWSCLKNSAVLHNENFTSMFFPSLNRSYCQTLSCIEIIVWCNPEAEKTLWKQWPWLSRKSSLGWSASFSCWRIANFPVSSTAPKASRALVQCASSFSQQRNANQCVLLSLVVFNVSFADLPVKQAFDRDTCSRAWTVSVPVAQGIN